MYTIHLGTMSITCDTPEEVIRLVGCHGVVSAVVESSAKTPNKYVSSEPVNAREIVFAEPVKSPEVEEAKPLVIVKNFRELDTRIYETLLAKSPMPVHYRALLPLAAYDHDVKNAIVRLIEEGFVRRSSRGFYTTAAVRGERTA